MPLYYHYRLERYFLAILSPPSIIDHSYQRHSRELIFFTLLQKEQLVSATSLYRIS